MEGISRKKSLIWMIYLPKFSYYIEHQEFGRNCRKQQQKTAKKILRNVKFSSDKTTTKKNNLSASTNYKKRNLYYSCL